MYKCNNCLSKVTEPLIDYEMHGFSYGRGEKVLLCPFCKISDLTSHVEEDDEMSGEEDD